MWGLVVRSQFFLSTCRDSVLGQDTVTAPDGQASSAAMCERVGK